jgi:hypothetical protein
MADHHIRFTLGSHIRFGSLDFLCMGVDHGLDPTGVEGDCVLPSPAESLSSPTNVDSISESMVGFCLHANKAQASGSIQPHGFDYLRLEHQLDAILGPRPS